MGKITEQTTFRELELELALLGGPTLTLTSRRVGQRGCCLHHKEYGFAFGAGATEAEALDDALTELRQKMLGGLATPRRA